MEEAAALQPVLKKMSEENGKGELADEDIVKAYEAEILKVAGPLEFVDLIMSPHEETFSFEVHWQGETRKLVGSGTGPIDACVKAMESIGQFFHLVDYRQVALNVERGEFAADAASEIRIQKRASKDGALLGPVVYGRGVDKDTIKANIKALINGMNLLIRK
jgi:hypothetical protein